MATESTVTNPAAAGNPGWRLSVDEARSIFEQMDAAGDADPSLVEKYYHPDVRFRDPIQQVEGRDEFIAMTARLVERCSELRAEVNDAAGAGDVIFLQWTMEMKLGPTPLTSIEGVTRLRLGEDGRIVEHRDYFDMWGDTLAAVPPLGPAYRRFMTLLG